MKAYFPAIIWLVVIVVLSGYPGDQLPKTPIWQFDKLVHSVIYFILSACLILAFRTQYQLKNKRFRTTGFILFIGIFYGGLMEILQNSIFINRSGNWYDFIANTIGAFLGVIFFPLLLKWLPFNKLNKE